MVSRYSVTSASNQKGEENGGGIIFRIKRLRPDDQGEARP
jgi:hypothetical protein